MCLKNLTACREKLTTSNIAAIVLVYAVLLIDNLLLTAVVPVLPEYLKKIYEPSEASNVKTISTASANKSFINSATSFIGENENKSVNCGLSNENKFFIKETLYIGLLFASKPFVQCFANLAVGPIVNRIGFNLPMVFGNVIMCLSAFLFAFGKSYIVLLLARAIQGIASASSSVVGISMLANRYKDNSDDERGKAIGIALGGLAMGVLIGPSFAGAVFQVAGKKAVFLILAIAAIVIAGFVVFINGIKIQKRTEENVPIPLSSLLTDPYIMLTAITLMFGKLGIGILGAIQPLWMLETMCSQKWELGVAFLPLNVSYLAIINITAVFCQKIPRWLVVFIGLILVGAGCFSTPFAQNLAEMIPPGVIHGFGIALVDSSIFPMMAVLVDTRHNSIYGSVYAIADLSFCLAYIIGPLYAGFLTKVLGFRWLMWIFAIVVIAYSPLILFLRKPTSLNEETMPILHHSESKNDDYVSSSNGAMVDATSEDGKD